MQALKHFLQTVVQTTAYRVAAERQPLGLDGRPAVKNLLEILTEWLAFRRDTVRRRLSTFSRR
ncbi:hypothetical protein L246_09085 [Salmonella enterica subsp. enterica serovar Worthington str. BCH-5715]|nr:hypothetical protein L246_09085 [Salmonella enterica subsp. enterica serovar Worthington str. BCH-5715]